MSASSLISVIVPIYNVAACLPRCLDSILAQTYTNLEILLVDDGSSDNSLEICQTYAAKDPRIRVSHQANQGVSAARNAGLAQAQGEYISFVDPDDWLAPQALARLCEAIQAAQASVAWGDFTYAYDNGADKFPPAVLCAGESAVLSPEEFICAASPRSDFGVCNKLFARQLIAAARFNPQYTQGEDLAFLTELLPKIHSVVYVNKKIYFYYQRPHSAQHSGKILSHQYNAQIGAAVYQTCRRCGFQKALPHVLGVWLLSTALYGAYILLLDTRNQYRAQLQEVVALFQQHRKFIFTTPYIWQPAKACMCLWAVCPTLVRLFCRCPGINRLLQKALACRVGANKTA